MKDKKYDFQIQLERYFSKVTCCNTLDHKLCAPHTEYMKIAISELTPFILFTTFLKSTFIVLLPATNRQRTNNLFGSAAPIFAKKIVNTKIIYLHSRYIINVINIQLNLLFAFCLSYKRANEKCLFYYYLIWRAITAAFLTDRTLQCCHTLTVTWNQATQRLRWQFEQAQCC